MQVVPKAPLWAPSARLRQARRPIRKGERPPFHPRKRDWRTATSDATARNQDLTGARLARALGLSGSAGRADNLGRYSAATQKRRELTRPHQVTGKVPAAPQQSGPRDPMVPPPAAGPNRVIGERGGGLRRTQPRRPAHKCPAPRRGAHPPPRHWRTTRHSTASGTENGNGRFSKPRDRAARYQPRTDRPDSNPTAAGSDAPLAP